MKNSAKQGCENMEIKMTTTDTPRTDEEMWTTDYHHELCNVVNTEFARQLEQELSHSLANQLKTQAEVERLNGLLSDLLILTEKIYWNSNNYKMIKEAYHDYK